MDSNDETTRTSNSITQVRIKEKTSVKDSTQPFDFRLDENVFTLRPSWSGCIMAIIIDNDRIRRSCEIIVA
jgi:hypothetical protein